jgi:hypothetical protein
LHHGLVDRNLKKASELEMAEAAEEYRRPSMAFRNLIASLGMLSKKKASVLLLVTLGCEGKALAFPSHEERLREMELSLFFLGSLEALRVIRGLCESYRVRRKRNNKSTT